MNGQEYFADENKEPPERRGKDECLMRVYTCPGLVDQIGGLCRRGLGGVVRLSTDAGRPYPQRIRQATAADVAAVGVVDGIDRFRDQLSHSPSDQTRQFRNGEAKENSRPLPPALL